VVVIRRRFGGFAELSALVGQVGRLLHKEFLLKMPKISSIAGETPGKSFFWLLFREL